MKNPTLEYKPPSISPVRTCTKQAQADKDSSFQVKPKQHEISSKRKQPIFITVRVLGCRACSNLQTLLSPVDAANTQHALPASSLK